MDRKTQDFLTWLIAIGVFVSQATPWVPEKPYIIGAAVGLLGLPSIRKAQDGVNRLLNGGDPEGVKK